MSIRGFFVHQPINDTMRATPLAASQTNWRSTSRPHHRTPVGLRSRKRRTSTADASPPVWHTPMTSIRTRHRREPPGERPHGRQVLRREVGDHVGCHPPLGLRSGPLDPDPPPPLAGRREAHVSHLWPRHKRFRHPRKLVGSSQPAADRSGDGSGHLPDDRWWVRLDVEPAPRGRESQPGRPGPVLPRPRDHHPHEPDKTQAPQRHVHDVRPITPVPQRRRCQE